MDREIIKIKISTEMVGNDAYILTSDTKMKYGEKHNCVIKRIPDNRLRSYEQLKLYWSICKFVSQNTEDENFNTPSKVDEQAKIYCRLFEHYIYYENKKTGESTLNIKTGSISYDNLDHLDACCYFDNAFEFLSQYMGMTKEELFTASKENKYLGLENIGNETEFTGEIYPAENM